MNKKTFIGILICILIGGVSAIFLYKNYKTEDIANVLEKKVYFVQVGAFKNYDNVIEITKTLPNYLIINEKNLYIIYVGISKEEDNIKKLNKIYNEKGFNTFVKSKKISNEKFLTLIEKYDLLLQRTNEKDMILNINKEVLKLYKEQVYEKLN